MSKNTVLTKRCVVFPQPQQFILYQINIGYISGQSTLLHSLYHETIIHHRIHYLFSLLFIVLFFFVCYIAILSNVNQKKNT